MTQSLRVNAHAYRGGAEPRGAGILRTAIAPAAVALLVVLTCACGVQETSKTAGRESEADEPTTTLTLLSAPTPAGESSSEIDPLPSAGPSLPEARERSEADDTAGNAELQAGPLLSESPEVPEEVPVGNGLSVHTATPSEVLTGDRSSIMPSGGEPQILHVDIDGDKAVIISGQDADTAQGLVGQRGEHIPAVPSPSKGQRFTWHDGDREAVVWQDTDLVVADVVPGDGWGDPSGPVFWSESNELMALPGGVVLVLDPTLNTTAVDAFMRSHNIDRSQVEAFEGLPNWFKVNTDPGFPSLLLANSLADQSGVIISSPNWWFHRLVE